jgi:hypothetical protein
MEARNRRRLARPDHLAARNSGGCRVTAVLQHRRLLRAVPARVRLESRRDFGRPYLPHAGFGYLRPHRRVVDRPIRGADRCARLDPIARPDNGRAAQSHQLVVNVLWRCSSLGGIGGGTTPIVYTRVVNANFTSSRGLALAIVLAGTGLAALVLPPVLAATIDASGRRAGFMFLATAAALAWPFVILGFRGVGGATPPRKTLTKDSAVPLL